MSSSSNSLKYLSFTAFRMRLRSAISAAMYFKYVCCLSSNALMDCNVSDVESALVERSNMERVVTLEVTSSVGSMASGSVGI